MNATSTAPFARKLGTARSALEQAQAAHTNAKDTFAKAVENSTVRIDLQEMFLGRATASQRAADSYAKCLRAIADIVATLPALKTAISDTESAIAPLARTVAELEKDGCHRCNGTGLYQAPTSHYSRGIPVCFHCNGSAMSQKAAKRAAANA